MSTNVNDTVAIWNQEHTFATTNLVTLEANLKTAYNAYIDALAVYIARVKEGNDIRDGYVRTLGTEDIINDTKTKDQFLYAAKPMIENNGSKYLLDPLSESAATKSATLVASCTSGELLERKA